jgi:hypothetical protein
MRSETLPTITTSLNQLINLRCLNLASYTNWPNSETPGLKLPSLYTFMWSSPLLTNQGASALFLDNCELAQLQNLTIFFWGEGEFKNEASRSIRRFLESHSSIKSLALGIPDGQPSMAIFPHLRSHITVLDYSIVALSATLIPMLPKSVTTLKVSTGINPEDEAWSVFDELASNETGVKTVVISIWATDDPGMASFSWAAGLAALTDPEQANSDIAVITGRMLAYSVKLANRGIEVVDGNGLAASVGLRRPCVYI